MDSDERVTDWNPAAADLFGYSAEEALGRPIDDLVLGDAGRDEGREVTREAITTGRAQRITPAHGGRTARAVDVELMLAPLTVDGAHVGFLGIYHDITRAPARARARRDAPDGDAGAREDAEPRGHDRGDPRRAAAGRALRQLLRAGDPGKPPGDRRRTRLRRSGGAARAGLRPGRREQPQQPGRAVEADTGLRRRLGQPAFRESTSAAARAFAAGSARR